VQDEPSTLNAYIDSYKYNDSNPNSLEYGFSRQANRLAVDLYDNRQRDPWQKFNPKPAAIAPGLLLFIVGFLFMPSWWVGTVYPLEPAHKDDRKWKRCCWVATVISVAGLIAVNIFILLFIIRRNP